MNDVEVFCPICGTKVATHNGRSKINTVSRCRKCNKRIVYEVGTGETLAKNMPLRTAASGIRL